MTNARALPFQGVDQSGHDPTPLKWLADETLYSISVRHVLLAGVHSRRITTQMLSGSIEYRGFTHFQTGLDAFAKYAGGRLGTAEEILWRRTVWASYLPFLTQAKADAAITVIKARDAGRAREHLRFLSILNNRYPAQNTLRLCDECVAQDKANAGYAHWRRAHQLAGAYRCIEHLLPLRKIALPNLAEDVERLPSIDPAHRKSMAVPLTSQSAAQEAAVQRVSAFANELANLPAGTRLDPTALAKVYASRMRQMGLNLTRFPVASTDACFLDFASALDGIADYQGWLRTTVAKERLITRMISASPMYPRPILHTIFIAWLFDSWGEFESAYAACRGPGETATIESDLSETSEHHGRPVRTRNLAASRQIFEQLMREGAQHTDAGAQAGVDAATGKKWAARLGAPMKASERAVPHALRGALATRLRSGDPYATIAKALQLGIASIANFCIFDSQLYEDRQEALTLRHHLEIERKLVIARASWARALSRSRAGDINVTLLVSGDGHYVSRHDPEGFRAMAAAHPEIHRKNRCIDGLLEQDVFYANAVTEVAAALRLVTPHRILHKWDIVLALEARGLLYMESERLMMPLAKAALSQAISNR